MLSRHRPPRTRIASGHPDHEVGRFAPGDHQAGVGLVIAHHPFTRILRGLAEKHVPGDKPVEPHLLIDVDPRSFEGGGWAGYGPGGKQDEGLQIYLATPENGQAASFGNGCTAVPT